MKDSPELAIKENGEREPISVQKQFLIALWYFGGNDTINKIADRFGISELSVVSSRNRIIDAILKNLIKKFITWPENPQEIEKQFRRRNGFPGILGALDGTRIEVKAPAEYPQCYVNRKNTIHFSCKLFAMQT